MGATGCNVEGLEKWLEVILTTLHSLFDGGEVEGHSPFASSYEGLKLECIAEHLDGTSVSSVEMNEGEASVC